jgi:hypothetical protein
MMDSFLCEQVKEHVSTVPLSTTEDLMVRFQADVTMDDANMLRHVQENSVSTLLSTSEMDGASNTCCNYEESMV